MPNFCPCVKPFSAILNLQFLSRFNKMPTAKEGGRLRIRDSYKSMGPVASAGCVSGTMMRERIVFDIRLVSGAIKPPFQDRFRAGIAAGDIFPAVE